MSEGCNPFSSSERRGVMHESLLGFLDDAWGQFELAERVSAGAQVMDTRIAGEGLRMRFASAALRRAIGRAFEHLRVTVPSDCPDLTVGVWDSMSSGVPMPPPPWMNTSSNPRRSGW